MTRMKTILAVLAAALSIGMAAPAATSAVTYNYCVYSLQGGGSLAPDPDVFEYANQVGARTVVLDHMSGTSGTYTVYAHYKFYRAADVLYRRFYCSGSGSTYSDGRAF